MKIILLLIATTITLGAMGQSNNELPKEINAVFDYILNKDFPELINEKPYQIRPIRWVIIDIDEDGVTEVFLQTFPHYRQSPTIIIYQIDQNDSISRITEALAPGHLIKISPEHDFFDTHSTGTAVDMKIDSSDPTKLRTLAKSSIKFGMSPVIFKNFIHTDMRDTKPTFLDLTYLDDYSNAISCEDFQYSLPDEITAGKINNNNSKYFVARVLNELYCYKILGFDENGWMNKEITIIGLPQDFKEFHVVDEKIKYISEKGKIKELKL